MKKTVTFVIFLSLVGFIPTFGKTPNEILRPARPVHKSFRIPFLQEQTYVESFKGSGGNNPLSKSEVLKYFDPSIFSGSSFNLITHIGPVTDNTGQPIVSPDGTNYYFDDYATHFSSLLPKPRLDSIKFYFFIDSMEKITGNGMVVSLVKEKEDTLTGTLAGDIIPAPNFGITAIKTPILIPASSFSHIGDSKLDSITVKFSGTLVPKEFFISLGGSVQTSATNVINNVIEFVADSVDLSGTWDDTAPFDTAALRSYYVYFNESFTYYGTFLRILDGRANGGGLFVPNLFMYAYLHDPNAAVGDNQISGNALGQNYPNPVTAQSEISYSLANEGRVSLKVYSALGVEIATLADNFESSGEHQASFNADKLPSGTYYYTLRAGDFTATKQMIVTK